jgi:short-subunit dehydrogenase
MRALVTGAAAGLGRAMGEAVLEGGGSLVALDRDENGLMALGEGVDALAADLADTAVLDGLGEDIAGCGPYDLVVMNAGINATGPFEAVPIAKQSAVIAINLTAPMALTAALLRHDAISPGGALVFVSSLSRFLSYPGAASYVASKHGIAVFAKSLRRPLAKQRIRVLAVFPGALDTGHAERHAPPAANGTRRMAPDVAAKAILATASRRSGEFVPGAGPRVLATLARLAPGPATAIMRRLIFQKLNGES